MKRKLYSYATMVYLCLKQKFESNVLPQANESVIFERCS